MSPPRQTLWPKVLEPLTEVQRRIQDDWMRFHHERMPTAFPRIERFNQTYPLKFARPGRTLEIGAGLGEHLRYENLEEQEYVTIELRENMAEVIRRNFPSVEAIVGDCQEAMPFPDHSFDRVVAIHILEHLPNLPAALDEVRRVLRPGGVLAVVIPCEGGKAYTLGRRVRTQPEFERRYKTSYRWHIQNDHPNVPHEILEEISKRFRVTDREFFPLRVPVVDLNLIIGVTAIAS